MKELKRYKEELAVIGLLSLVLLLVRWVSATVWPTTGQYDMAAQTETVFWTVLRLVIYTLAAWMGLRVVAPKVYHWLKHDVIDGFDKLPPATKDSIGLRMFAILFFGLVLLAMSGCTPAQAATPAGQRNCVLMQAAADVGVRESTGRNDGPEVERYLAHVGLGKGHAWCAAFVSYHLSKCGVANPRSAWSPAFAAEAQRVWTPRKASRSLLPGDVFSLYYANLGRVGHVGFVSGAEGRYILTIEGNTSGPGSREGDGVYARRRELSKIHAITNYINDPVSAAGGGAERLQGQAQQRADLDDRADHGNPFRRVSARYIDPGAGGPRGGHTALAALRGGPAADHGAQRTGMEHRGHHGWTTLAQRGLRQPGVGGHLVRHVAAIAPGQGRGGDPVRDGDRDAGAKVGLVGTGIRHCRPAALGVAAATALSVTLQSLFQ